MNMNKENWQNENVMFELISVRLKTFDETACTKFFWGPVHVEHMKVDLPSVRMAAAVRVRIGNITRNYVQTLLLQSHRLKIKQKVCFHNSTLLCGEYWIKVWVYCISWVAVLILVKIKIFYKCGNVSCCDVITVKHTIYYHVLRR